MHENEVDLIDRTGRREPNFTFPDGLRTTLNGHAFTLIQEACTLSPKHVEALRIQLERQAFVTPTEVAA